jgi:hypothetical protein
MAATSVFAHTACRLSHHYAGPKDPNYLPKTRACILRSDQVRSMSAIWIAWTWKKHQPSLVERRRTSSSALINGGGFSSWSFRTDFCECLRRLIFAFRHVVPRSPIPRTGFTRSNMTAIASGSPDLAASSSTRRISSSGMEKPPAMVVVFRVATTCAPASDPEIGSRCVNGN